MQFVVRKGSRNGVGTRVKRVCQIRSEVGSRTRTLMGKAGQSIKARVLFLGIK